MSFPLNRGVYRLDPMHTQIMFSIKHLGITPLRGMFTAFSGTLSTNGDAASTSLDLEVDISSMQSGQQSRDGHMQAEDFFDVKRHPKMSLRSIQITGDGERFTIEGDLTIKGITQKAAFSALYTGRAIFPMDQKEHIGVVGSGSISRLAYQIGSQIPTTLLSDEIELNLAIQLVDE